ncbi:MAG: reprolysin-like metallopeptidase, partial [Flavisolibacter sp.]
MKSIVLLTCMSALLTITAFSQAGKFWTPNNESRSNIAQDKAASRASYPREFKLFNLDLPGFNQALLAIAGNNRKKLSAVISLPNANGGMEDFELVEASNFEPALQAQFPSIRAFSGKGITDRYATVKLSISPHGIESMIFRTNDDNEFIEAYSADHTVYSVYKAHREKARLPWTCSTEDKGLVSDINGRLSAANLSTGSSTGTLKTLRLAQSCNGEYAN